MTDHGSALADLLSPPLGSRCRRSRSGAAPPLGSNRLCLLGGLCFIGALGFLDGVAAPRFGVCLWLPVEWALYRTDQILGDSGVPSRGANGPVPQESLNDSDVSAAFEEMCGKCMPQRMGRHSFLDPKLRCRSIEGFADGARSDRFVGIPAREEVVPPRAYSLPILAQAELEPAR